MRVVLISATALEVLQVWAKFAGEWISEIEFELEGLDRTQILSFMLQPLQRHEPALFRHTVQATVSARISP